MQVSTARILFTATLLCAACSSTANERSEASGEDDEALGAAAVPTEQIATPAGAPHAWPQPPSDGVVGQWGYCGATAAANLLAWYGRDDVDPKAAIDAGCWSYLAGTFPHAERNCIDALDADLHCALAKADAEDPFGTLRAHLEQGQPVIVLYMTGVLAAHWVVVTGVDDEHVDVMSWGKYLRLGGAEFRDAWRRAYSGPYPMIACEARSSLSGLRF